MPYISTTTNVSITAEKETVLKQRLGKAIEQIPGKNENWLMLSFSPDTKMYFHGDDSDMAFLSVSILGKATAADYENLTSELCDIISTELGIAKDYIYIKYEESSYWGWNGSNF